MIHRIPPTVGGMLPRVFGLGDTVSEATVKDSAYTTMRWEGPARKVRKHAGKKSRHAAKNR